MNDHRIRFVPGMGHQILDKKGKLHSVHDEASSAEEALETLNNKKAKKEHELPYWDKK